jgi:thymidylate synthase (FAD)
MVFEVKPSAKLVGVLGYGDIGPEELVAFGARATMKKGDAHTLYQEAVEKGEVDRIKQRLLDITISSGHIDVLDQAVFTFVFRDVPRLTTLFLVSPLYLSHLQQSMRYVEPYGIYLPEELKEDREVTMVMEKSMEMYYNMVENGVPKEDARFILPLYTVTNIQTTGNARELTHLFLMARDDGVPKITGKLVNDALSKAMEIAPELFKDRGPNYYRVRYYPAPRLFAKENRYMRKIIEEHDADPVALLSYDEPFTLDENELKKALKDEDEKFFGLLKHNVYVFLTKMSLVTYHQAVRQRTWQHYVESIYDALKRLDYVIPPEIARSKWRDKFIEQVERQYNLYHELVEKGYSPEDAVGVISHAHTVYDLIRIDGWNYIGALPIRRCLRAQWEIRMITAEISRYVSNINPALGKYSLPPCLVFGDCPEKHPCEYMGILTSRRPLIEG